MKYRLLFVLVIAASVPIVGYSPPQYSPTQAQRPPRQTNPCGAQATPQSVQRAPAPPLVFNVVDRPGKIREEHGELFFGGYVQRLTLDLPRARGSYQPELTLLYHSNQRDTGWLGAGWDISLGGIERNTRDGIAFSGRDYVLRLLNKELELVDCGKDGLFAAKYEDDFLRIRQTPPVGLPSEWKVTATNGTTFVFGRTADAKQADPSNASNVFAWMLERVEDVSGNFLSATYTRVGSRPYLAEVAYNGHVDSGGATDIDPTHKILFSLETRQDVYESYATRFRDVLDKRLKRIDITSDSLPFSTIDFAYTASESTGHSLLASVVQRGRDGTAVSLLDIKYYTPRASFARDAYTRPRLRGLDGNKYWMQYPDLNGDGLDDFCGRYTTGVECHVSAHSVLDPYGRRHPFESDFDSRHAFADTDGWSEPSNFATVRFVDIDADGNDDACGRHRSGLMCWVTEPWATSFRGSAVTTPIFRDSDGFADPARWQTIQFGDINGDARIDVCAHVNTRVTCWLGDGNGSFVDRIDGPTISFEAQFAGSTRVVDVNGDHSADICSRTEGGVACWLWDDGQFEATARVTAILIGAPWTQETHYRTLQFPDLNGDAVPDACARGETHIECWLGTGMGTFATRVVGPHLGKDLYPFRFWDAIQYPDMNADGRSDFCAHGDSSYNCWVSVTDGHKGYGLARYTYIPKVGPEAGLFGLADANGDGSAELCSPDYTGTIGGGGAGGDFGCLRLFELRPNLVSQIKTALGGTVTVDFDSSASFNNTALRAVFPVLKSITESDGRGLSSMTTIRYENGFFNYAKHRFYGFGHITVGGPSGGQFIGGYNTQDIWFHQGAATRGLPASEVQPALIGRPFRIRLADDPIGNFETVTRLTYSKDDRPPYHHQVSRIDTDICRGSRFQVYPNFGRCKYAGNEKNASTIHTAQTFEYDVFGNVTLETDFGELNVDTDDVIIRRQFATNLDAWLVRTPLEVETYGVKNGTEGLVSAVRFRYDGTTACSGTSSGGLTTTRGLVTREDQWVQGNVWVSRRFGYDGLGNEVCSRDGNGNETLTTFDRHTQTLPVREVNALGHVAASDYWGLDGDISGGVFGQLKRRLEPNQTHVEFAYDSVGRPHVDKRSDGQIITRDYVDIGDPATQRITIKTLDGADLLSETSSYLDGYGRVVLASLRGPGGRPVETQYEYDTRGFLRSITAPAFASPASGTDALKWEFITDAQGFRLQTTDPLGSTRRMCQNQQAIIEVAENGDIKRVYYDARGRIARVEQYLGKSATNTEYSCDVWANVPYSTTRYEYDIRGLLTRIVDEKGNVWQFAYDGIGRRVEAIDPDRGTQRFQYGGANELRQVTRATGKQMFYRYDALTRLTQLDFDRQKPQGSGDRVFEYDLPRVPFSVGRLGRVRSANGPTISISFDVAGRETVRQVDWRGSSVTVRREYDALDRLRAVHYPSGRTIAYAYDGPVLKTLAEGAVVHAEYSSFSPSLQPTRVRFANGTVTELSYAGVMGTTCGAPYHGLCSERVTLPGGTQPHMDLQYVYDGGGAIKTIENKRTLGVTSLHYDGLGRLTGSTGSAASSTYQYDPLHNRIGDSSLGTYQMSVPPNPVHGVASIGTNRLQYDRDGNTTRDGALTFEYDSSGRIAAVKRVGFDLRTNFDWEGNLVATQLGLDFRLMISPYLEKRQGGSHEFFVVDGKPVGRVDGSQVVYYHHDLFGSLRAASDERGALVASWEYDVFGNLPQSAAAGIEDRPVFAGGAASGINDLFWFGDRLYSPTRGAFEMPDSREADSREPRSLNPYAYTWHNPTRYVDRGGEWPDWSNPGFVRGGLALAGIAATIILFPPAAAAIATAEGAVAIAAAQIALTNVAILGGTSATQLVGATFQLTSDAAVAESWDESWSWASNMMDPNSAMAGSVSLVAFGSANPGFFGAKLYSLNSAVGSLAKSQSGWEAAGNLLKVSRSLNVTPPQSAPGYLGRFRHEPPDPLGIGPRIDRGGFDPEAEGRYRYKYVG